MQFNEAQQEAVDFYQGPCLTLAGPGSGKTAVITHRTKNLIEKYGVSPSEILVVTIYKSSRYGDEGAFSFANESDIHNGYFWYFSCGVFYGIKVCLSLSGRKYYKR